MAETTKIKRETDPKKRLQRAAEVYKAQQALIEGLTRRLNEADAKLAEKTAQLHTIQKDVAAALKRAINAEEVARKQPSREYYLNQLKEFKITPAMKAAGQRASDAFYTRITSDNKVVTRVEDVFRAMVVQMVDDFIEDLEEDE